MSDQSLRLRVIRARDLCAELLTDEIVGAELTPEDRVYYSGAHAALCSVLSDDDSVARPAWITERAWRISHRKKGPV